MAFRGGIVYNAAMNIKLTLGAAVAACLFAACGGTKSIGYVGASSGGKPGALHIVEVDNETGDVAVKGTLLGYDLHRRQQGEDAALHLLFKCRVRREGREWRRGRL